jgi:hypothetical protein
MKQEWLFSTAQHPATASLQRCAPDTLAVGNKRAATSPASAAPAAVSGCSAGSTGKSSRDSCRLRLLHGCVSVVLDDPQLPATSRPATHAASVWAPCPVPAYFPLVRSVLHSQCAAIVAYASYLRPTGATAVPRAIIGSDR